MNLAHHLRAIGLTILGFSASCSSEVDSVRRYAGTAVAQTVTSTKGNLVINNRNGSVWVDTAGDTTIPMGGIAPAGMITVVGEPFAMGASDDAAKQAATAAMNALKLTVLPNASGDLVVTGTGDDSSGYDLTVHVPYPFGGALTINVTNGYVHYVGSSGGSAATINVAKGDIFVQDGGKKLAIKGGQSNINVIALPTIAGTSIATDYGNITAQIPDSANITITATSLDGGTVTPPPNRSVQVDTSGDDSTSSFDLGPNLRPLALSTVAPDHKSAVIVLGNLQLGYTLTVTAGHGNVVFR
jgi:hypothetical protein